MMTKKRKKEIAKKLLYRGVLTSKEKRWLYYSIFQYHECIEEKKGVGIKDIIIAKPKKWSGICFHILRLDNSKAPVSISKSLNKPTKYQDINIVLRHIIYPQIVEFRNDNDIPFEMQIDHCGQYEFKDIVKIFMQDKNEDYVYSKIIKSDVENNKFSCSELTNEFYLLHKDKAILQALTKEQHYNKTYK